MSIAPSRSGRLGDEDGGDGDGGRDQDRCGFAATPLSSTGWRPVSGTKNDRPVNWV
jgi:hypothetical protein